MNTQAHKGIAPRTTHALKEERAARRLFGDDVVDAHNADRRAYYDALRREAMRRKARAILV